MTIDELRATLHAESPPADLPPLLKALWWDAKGNFDRAHEIAQDEEAGQEAAWVHAYLHRKEGDRDNAGYWYRKAGKPIERGPLDAEWSRIVTALLSD